MVEKSTPIVVMGLGFVGLSCFVGLKELGFNVTGVEKNPQRISDIRRKSKEILEGDVCNILDEKPYYLDSIFSTVDDLSSHYSKMIVVICVGTPELPSGRTDNSFIIRCIEDTYRVFKNSEIEFVIKSTIPPGTCHEVISPLIYDLFGERARCVSNPEFLREGHALSDFLEPDRIVIGRDSESASWIETLYQTHFDNVLVCNTKTAEFSKYLSNSALALMISFSNEMRMFSDLISDIDVKMSFQQFSLDRRWKDASMASYFWPGIGFGGYCLPKDTLSIFSMMTDFDFKSEIMSGIINTNNKLIEYFVNKIKARSNSGARIVFLGSSFKVGSDDIRNSKTVELVNALKEENVENLFLLTDASSHRVIEENRFLTELTENEVKDSDILVVVLRDNAFLPLVCMHPKANVIDIPLLI